jgi:nitroreductase
METIFQRHSIRTFRSNPVNDDTITSILKAGMAAPSAGNEQPWEFIIIRNREQLEAFIQVSPNAQMLSTAPVAILVCGNMQRERYTGFWALDCAAATENILLEATFLELGSVWVGIYPNRERMVAVSRMFQLPDYVVPFALIPLGVAAESSAEEERFHPEWIHWEEWKDTHTFRG